MRVFLSWSGNTSRELAEAFSEWLPSVLQLVQPYFTPDDIEKGKRWFDDVSGELDSCNMGLLFLTQDNLEAPWIMFEAGALSKKLDVGRVSPLLFEIEPTDIKGPLAHFQATPFMKVEVQKLIQSLNRRLGEQALSTTVLSNTFEKWWPDLEQKVTAILQHQPEASLGEIRTDRDLIEETLQLVRSLSSPTTTSTLDSERMWRNLTNRANQTWGAFEKMQIMMDNDNLPLQYREALANIRVQVLGFYHTLTEHAQPMEYGHPTAKNYQISHIDSLPEFVEHWSDVLVHVKRRIGITAVAYLHDAYPVVLNDEEIVLEYRKKFHHKKACEAAERLPFEEVVNEFLSHPRRLRFRLNANSEDTEV